jgi:hypothetical protein
MQFQANLSTQLRDQAASIAATNPVGALEIARRIDEPWFRCQALAYAALHCPESAQRIKIIDESFEASENCRTDYKRVAVAVWPLKVLVLSQEEERYRVRIGVLLDQAKAIENPISCVHAIEQILGAINGAPKEIVGAVLTEVETACRKIRSWKVDSAIQHVAVCYFAHAPHQMLKLVESMTNKRIQRKTLMDLELTREHPPIPGWPNIGFEEEEGKVVVG